MKPFLFSELEFKKEQKNVRFLREDLKKSGLLQGF